MSVDWGKPGPRYLPERLKKLGGGEENALFWATQFAKAGAHLAVYVFQAHVGQAASIAGTLAHTPLTVSPPLLATSLFAQPGVTDIKFHVLSFKCEHLSGLIFCLPWPKPRPTESPGFGLIPTPAKEPVSKFFQFFIFIYLFLVWGFRCQLSASLSQSILCTPAPAYICSLCYATTA